MDESSHVSIPSTTLRIAGSTVWSSLRTSRHASSLVGGGGKMQTPECLSEDSSAQNNSLTDSPSSPSHSGFPMPTPYPEVLSSAVSHPCISGRSSPLSRPRGLMLMESATSQILSPPVLAEVPLPVFLDSSGDDTCPEMSLESAIIGLGESIPPAPIFLFPCRTSDAPIPRLVFLSLCRILGFLVFATLYLPVIVLFHCLGCCIFSPLLPSESATGISPFLPMSFPLSGAESDSVLFGHHSLLLEWAKKKSLSLLCGAPTSFALNNPSVIV